MKKLFGNFSLFKMNFPKEKSRKISIIYFFFGCCCFSTFLSQLKHTFTRWEKFLTFNNLTEKFFFLFTFFFFCQKLLTQKFVIFFVFVFVSKFEIKKTQKTFSWIFLCRKWNKNKKRKKEKPKTVFHCCCFWLKLFFYWVLRKFVLLFVFPVLYFWR